MVFSGEGCATSWRRSGEPADARHRPSDPVGAAPVDHVMGAPISDEDKIAILGGNAAKLFGIKANGAT
jgi:hypothetical protein